MYKTSFRISLFVIILMLPMVVVQAAGLGKLTLNSALGQPLNAEIDIVITSSDEVQSLKAGVASRDAYANAGISYESILSSIRASVELRTNGAPYVKLTSPQAINDPFLMVLMELSWASGRILREYTVLLDPIETSAQGFVAANTNRDPEFIESPLEIEATPAVRSDDQTKKSNKSPSNSSRQAKNTYGPVNRGDTLSSIARQVMPSGVNLNQMLVALHRANRDAFIAGNMNLLKVGAVLTVPEKSEIVAIDTATASNEIKIQVDDWRNYQGKLAGISRATPISRDISQSDRGHITASIEKKSPALSDAPKEVLKLSSGAQLSETGGESTDSSLVDRLRMMEEDAIARNLALKEANERVAVLERSIQNLKHLLELKDSVLAQAQMNAESISDELATIPPVNVAPAAEGELNSEIEIFKEQEQSQNISAINSAVGPEKNVTASSNPIVMPEDEDSSLIDLVFEYIEYIGAISILILLLVLLKVRKRSAKMQDDGDDSGGAKDNFSSAMRSRLAAMGSAQAASAIAADRSLDEHEADELDYDEMKSTSESEDHSEDFGNDSIHYGENEEDGKESGLSPEAESVEDNLEQDGYAFDRDFTESATEDLEQSMDSDKVEDPENFSPQIDFDLDNKSGSINNDLSMDRDQSEISDAEDGFVDSDSIENLKQSAEDSDYGLELDFDKAEQFSEAENIANDVPEEQDDGVDFDLRDSAINLTEDSDNDAKLPELNDPISLADDTVDETAANEPLEFEPQKTDAFEETEIESASKVPELGLADINLDLEEQPQLEKGAEQIEALASDEQWQEVETKLDLAKAYLEMDDKEGAKEMLEEVIKDGNDKQKKAAKKMLKGL